MRRIKPVDSQNFFSGLTELEKRGTANGPKADDYDVEERTGICHVHKIMQATKKPKKFSGFSLFFPQLSINQLPFELTLAFQGVFSMLFKFLLYVRQIFFCFGDPAETSEILDCKKHHSPG